MCLFRPHPLDEVFDRVIVQIRTAFVRAQYDVFGSLVGMSTTGTRRGWIDPGNVVVVPVKVVHSSGASKNVFDIPRQERRGVDLRTKIMNRN